MRLSKSKDRKFTLPVFFIAFTEWTRENPNTRAAPSRQLTFEPAAYVCFRFFFRLAGTSLSDNLAAGRRPPQTK